MSLERLNDCPICGCEGMQRPVERLPVTGTLMKMRHPDGTEHKWAEYNSMFEIEVPAKMKTPPKIIVCPVCNKKGRVNAFTPTHTKTANTVEYLVTHEKIEGTWGKRDHKIARRRRCYITKPTDRITILKKLGRYIPPVNTLDEVLEK